MLNRFLAVVLMFLVVACTSGPTDRATEVMWHGSSPARQYSFVFVDSNKSPVRGVSFKCIGDEGTIASKVASDLNESATSSDSLGTLIIAHNGFQTHGTYMRREMNVGGLIVQNYLSVNFFIKGVRYFLVN